MGLNSIPPPKKVLKTFLSSAAGSTTTHQYLMWEDGVLAGISRIPVGGRAGQTLRKIIQKICNDPRGSQNDRKKESMRDNPN